MTTTYEEPAVRIELTTAQYATAAVGRECGTAPCAIVAQGLASGAELPPLQAAVATERPPARSPRPCKRCGTVDVGRFGRKLFRGQLGWQPYCRTCQVDYHREWRQTADGRAKMRAGVTASRNRYPEKDEARALLQKAVVAGAIVRGPCYALGVDCAGKIEAHHDDYTKALDVTWTCRRHHRALDRQRQEGAA